MNKYKSGNRDNRNSRNKHKINEEIRYNEVRLNHMGESTIMSISKVREIADRLGEDIMLLTETANPPVVQICDYEKYLYKEKKKADEQKKLNSKHNKEMKEIRLTPMISENDLEVKKKKIEEFILNGHKVKLDMNFKGRMIVHSEIGKTKLLELIVGMDDILKADSLPKLNGKHMTVILTPKK